MPKKAVERNAKLALEKGFTHKESKGRLRKYFDYLFLSHGRGANIRLYGNHVYIFTRDKLVTVIPIPNAYKATLKRAMEKRDLQQEKGVAGIEIQQADA